VVVIIINVVVGLLVEGRYQKDGLVMVMLVVLQVVE
jgi:hypothetical protein